ncbi:MAG: DNA adenine methylase [Ignavibacteria bacterium]|nr:DNA adenine methylase [Ignavibacteria bacterium]
MSKNHAVKKGRENVMSKKKNPLIKPYLKWAGGKRQLLNDIRPFIPTRFTTYYEPFVGAGAVLFDLQPKRAVINDFNEQLITTYRIIKNNVEELIVLLRDYKEKNSDEFFYAIRELDRDREAFGKLSDIEIAARFIFMNKTCYNGLYRVNSSGLFNVPYGKYKNPMICDEPVLRAVSHYLSSNDIELHSGDFAAVLNTADRNSFVYFDPPYHSDDDTNFTGYQAGGFNAVEQTRLRDVFDELSRRGVKCLLSNADTPFIRELYANYTIETVMAKRAINSDADGRGDVKEVLIRNY